MAKTYNSYLNGELKKSKLTQPKDTFTGLTPNTEYNVQFAEVLGDRVGNKSPESKIKTKPVVVTGVTLNKKTLPLETGKSETLTAAVAPTTATNKGVTWTSSEPNVASVNGGAVSAIKSGTTTITVTTADGNKTDTCVVTVKDPVIAVTGVKLNKSTLSLEEAASETLTATVEPGNATTKSVTWKSSEPTIASVTNGVVKALKAGDSTITATTTEGNKTANCQVTVTAPPEPEPEEEPA